MSRFNSLEFGDSFEGDFESQQTAKDEAFYFGEATAAFQSADFEKALRYYAKVLEFNPKQVMAWAGQVKALIELREFREAKLWAEQALEKFPDEPELLAAKAVALARLGDLKAALAFSDASIEERGNTPYIWLARADVLTARKEKRADYCFEKAFMLAAGDWFVRWFASRILAFHEKFSLALKYAQEALNLNTATASVWMQLGQCQLALGLVVLAENSFAQAKELDANCVGVQEAINQVSGQGWFSRARSRLRQLFH